jgi:hypothetical protein
VPESPSPAPTTSSTLAQLLVIDSQLSVQEASLRAQLESIQLKRNSLQVVISLFGEKDKIDFTASIVGVKPRSVRNGTFVLRNVKIPCIYQPLPCIY